MKPLVLPRSFTALHTPSSSLPFFFKVWEANLVSKDVTSLFKFHYLIIINVELFYYVSSLQGLFMTCLTVGIT